MVQALSRLCVQMLLLVALCVVLSLAAAVPFPLPAAPKETLKGEEAVYLGYGGLPFVYPGAVAYVG